MQHGAYLLKIFQICIHLSFHSLRHSGCYPWFEPLVSCSRFQQQPSYWSFAPFPSKQIFSKADLNPQQVCPWYRDGYVAAIY